MFDLAPKVRAVKKFSFFILFATCGTLLRQGKLFSVFFLCCFCPFLSRFIFDVFPGLTWSLCQFYNVLSTPTIDTTGIISSTHSQVLPCVIHGLLSSRRGAIQIYTLRLCFYPRPKSSLVQTFQFNILFYSEYLLNALNIFAIKIIISFFMLFSR